MLRAECDRALKRTLDLEQDRKSGFDKVLALEAAVARTWSPPRDEAAAKDDPPDSGGDGGVRTMAT